MVTECVPISGYAVYVFRAKLQRQTGPQTVSVPLKHLTRKPASLKLF